MSLPNQISDPNIPDQPLTAIVFVDGQNLFYDVEKSWGYPEPNYNIRALSEKICLLKNWFLKEVRFYTGVPSEAQSKKYKRFWDNKLFDMKYSNVEVIRKVLKNREVSIQLYNNVEISIPPIPIVLTRNFELQTDDGQHTLCQGTTVTQWVLGEKEIDVSIAVDSVRCAYEKSCDVFVYFSRDSDLYPAVAEIKRVCKLQFRSIEVYSAFPEAAPGSKVNYGIPGTKDFRFKKELYDQCLDSKNYFSDK